MRFRDLVVILVKHVSSGGGCVRLERIVFTGSGGNTTMIIEVGTG